MHNVISPNNYVVNMFIDTNIIYAICHRSCQSSKTYRTLVISSNLEVVTNVSFLICDLTRGRATSSQPTCAFFSANVLTHDETLLCLRHRHDHVPSSVRVQHFTKAEGCPV